MTQNVRTKVPAPIAPIVAWVAGLKDQLWLASVAGWLCAFQKLITLEGTNAYYLGIKYPEEADEAREAWDEYIITKQLHPQAKHQLNSLWLHAMDELADVVNTHVARMLSKALRLASTRNDAEVLTEMLAKSVAVAIVLVETKTGRLDFEVRQALCTAVVSMAAAKLQITSLRPHWSECRVDWGEFPTGEPAE